MAGSQKPADGELISTKLDSPLLTSFYTEKQLSEKVKKAAREKCAAQMQLFVDCTKENNFTAPFRPKCRKALKEANECLRIYNSSEEVDKLRLEFTRTLQHRLTHESTSDGSSASTSSH